MQNHLRKDFSFSLTEVGPNSQVIDLLTGSLLLFIAVRDVFTTYKQTVHHTQEKEMCQYFSAKIGTEASLQVIYMLSSNQRTSSPSHYTSQLLNSILGSVTLGSFYSCSHGYVSE